MSDPCNLGEPQEYYVGMPGKSMTFKGWRLFRVGDWRVVYDEFLTLYLTEDRRYVLRYDLVSHDRMWAKSKCWFRVCSSYDELVRELVRFGRKKGIDGLVREFMNKLDGVRCG